MFNLISSAVDAAKQLFGSEANDLRQGLSGIDRFDSVLATRAYRFVLDGSDVQVLMDLRASTDKLGVVLGDPGRLATGFYPYSHTQAESDAGKHSLKGRDAFYRRASLDPACIAMLVRLGKVLEAADHGTRIDYTGASMPDWLHYLLNDAAWATIPDASYYDTAATSLKIRPQWNIQLLLAILQHEELPEALALNIVFERRAMSSYMLEHVYTCLLGPGALDDYMLANAQALEAAAATLSATGRLLLCKRIAQNRQVCAAMTALVMKLAVGDSKNVRSQAASMLELLDRNACQGELGTLLRGGSTEERCNAADLLARTQGIEGLAMLEAALDSETSKPVQQAIRNALSRLQAAGDAADLELPAPPPLPPFEHVELGADAIELLLANRVELLERLRKAAEDEEIDNRTAQYKGSYQRNHYARYRGVSEGDLRLALDALRGDTSKRAIASLESAEVRETLHLGNRLESRTDFGLLHVMRWIACAYPHFVEQSSGWHAPAFQLWLQGRDPEQVDLRQLASLAEQCGMPGHTFTLSALRSYWGDMRAPFDVLPPHRIWPYFAEHPELIDEGLGLIPAQREGYAKADLGHTLRVLATFPVIPARWLPRVMEFALGEGRTHRAAAQEVLSGLPDIGKRVTEALGANKQELRIEAARWLAKLKYREAIPHLYAALQKENRETASAALMTALEHLGEDMAPHLAPDKLLAQAKKGLKAKLPAGLAWLKLENLPACRWQDGTSVDQSIIQWWVVLACKLKEPSGNALLDRYLDLLDHGSRATLGAHILHQIIAQDTACQPLEAGIAHAKQYAAQQYQNYQMWAKKYPEYHAEKGKLTEEQVFEELKREKMREYLGSAIGEKGLLALVPGMPGHDMVNAIQNYMRDHYQRRAQIEAMLEAACNSNEASVIQFALGIARRYRTASVQEKARVLVERIAERNGWTQDQLADRTIPTGGLDDTGKLVLQYGSREFTVKLDAAMKPVLHNAEGKAVSALPAARQDDAPESIKEAKQLFSTCKKELKQVIDMQTARLYEAMCAGRTWPVADWLEYLHAHPIMGRLVQRLVWMECREFGTPRLFRPTDDGSLLDLGDTELTLAPDEKIRLVHGSLIDPAVAKAWLTHFKDYKVTPLFGQLQRQGPQADLLAQSMSDRLGWVSDTYTLRGIFNKLGYQRGQAEDGGVFFEYKKDFTSAGIRVCIEFSGSSLPEENLPAALKGLSFTSCQGYTRIIAAESVPPVLLAEAYADYHAVAAACSGYDPEWERKMPW
jgi:hypothetical protein